MSHWGKIGLEALLAIATLIASGNFWHCVKYTPFWRRTLGDTVELRHMLRNVLKRPLEEGDAATESDHLPFGWNIKFHIDSQFYALRKARNMVAGIIFLCLAGSYFIGFIPLIINIACIGIMSFTKFDGPAKENLEIQLSVVFINVKQCIVLDRERCRKFCTEGEYRYLYNIFELANTSMKRKRFRSEKPVAD